MDGRNTIRQFDNSTIKALRRGRLFIVILANLLIGKFSLAQTGPHVQPMQYRHYSYTGQVNIGNSVLKITNPSAFLELGDSLNSKKGFLPPRGYTDSIANPSRGLVIFDLRGNKLKWYNGAFWDSTGASGGPGGPFMELADTAAMLLNYRHWLAGYQKVSNLSTNVLLGASNTLYPSQLAVKTYVDNQLAGIGSGTFVPNSRTLVAGTWINNTLGDLSTNRTVGIDTATLFNQTTGALRRKDSLTTTNLKGYVTRKILGDSMAIWRANSGILGQPTVTYGLLATTLDFPRTGLSTLALDLIGGNPTSSSNIPYYNGSNLAWNSGLAIRASNVVTSGTDTLAPKSWVRANFGSGGGSSTLNSTYIGFGNGSNALTGSVDLTYSSNVVALEVPSSMQGGYNILHSGIGRLNFNYDQTANLSQIQAANSPFRIDFGQSTTSDPGSPTDGMMWYNSTSDFFKIRANGITDTLNAPFYVDEDYFAGKGTADDPFTLNAAAIPSSDNVWTDPLNDLPAGVTLGTSTKQQRTDAWQAAIAYAQTNGRGIRYAGYWDVYADSLVINGTPPPITGIGMHFSQLTTTDASGIILKINNPTPRGYYNVIFPNAKGAIVTDMGFRYLGSSNPTTVGLKINADTSISFLNKVSRVLFDSMYVGLEMHNTHSNHITDNYFRSTRADDILLTNNESLDYGKHIITGNVFTYPAEGTAGSPDTTYVVHNLGSAGVNFINNDVYGYKDFGVFTDFKTAGGEHFPAFVSSEHFFKDNRVLFVKEYAFYFHSAYGEGGVGTAVTGNRIQNIHIEGNETGFNGLIYTKGGAGSISELAITGNTNEVPQQSPGLFKIPIVIDGDAITNFTMRDNIITASVVGGAPIADATTPVTATGAISGSMLVRDNHYIDFPDAPAILDQTSGSQWTSTGSDIYFNTGNVGIGTSSPTSYAAKVLHIQNSLAPSSGIKLTDSTTGATNNDGLDFTMSGLDGYVINREAGAINFYTNTTERFVITSAGALKITTAPATSAGSYDILTRNSSTGAIEKVSSVGGADLQDITDIGRTTTNSIVAGNAAGATDEQSWMKLSAAAAADVDNGIAVRSGATAFYMYNNGTSPKIDAYNYGTASAMDIGIGGNGGTVKLDGETIMTKNQATTDFATTTKLRVRNTNATGISAIGFDDGTTWQGGLQYNNGSGSQNIFAYTAGAYPFYFGTNSSVRMTIKSSGVINISSTSTYADNTAALGGGLVAGDIYKTSTGILMIVY